MAYSLKKMWASLAFTLVASTSFVNANNAPVTNGNYHSDFCAPASCNPCAPPCSRGCWGDIEFTAEALVFKACEDGLAYGTEVTEQFVGCSDCVRQPIESHVKHPHFKWDWGFRLGLSYALPCDCWGVQVDWTHFRTHARGSFAGNPHSVSSTVPGSFFIPGWGSTSQAGFINNTTAHLNLRVDLVDVELGRAFCISQCLTLRPHIGVRAAWINQRYHVNSFGLDSDAVPVIDELIQEVNLKTDFTAAGLRGGLDSQWDLGCGFSLYGCAAVSVVYGSYDNRSQNFWQNEPPGSPESPSEFFDVEQKDDFCACRAITDAGLGLRWRGCLCGDSLLVTLQLGWEHHLFINFNEFEDFVQLDQFAPDDAFGIHGEVKNPQFHRGDLCLKGISFGAKVDF